MLATLSLVIRHEALARRGETIYRKFTRERPCSSIGLAVTPFKKGHDHQKKRTQHVKRPENRPAREVVNKSSENTQAGYQN
jgi:hypothetical protein